MVTGQLYHEVDVGEGRQSCCGEAGPDVTDCTGRTVGHPGHQVTSLSTGKDMTDSTSQHIAIIRQVFIMLCSGTTYVFPALKGNLVMTVYRHCPAATLSNLVNQAEQSNSTIYTLRQQILFVLLDDVCWRNFSQRKNTAPNPWTLSNGNCVFCLL